VSVEYGVLRTEAEATTNDRGQRTEGVEGAWRGRGGGKGGEGEGGSRERTTRTTSNSIKFTSTSKLC
jgi:hypothetical protein